MGVIIGLTGFTKMLNTSETYTVQATYVNGVKDAGAVPLLIPINEDLETVKIYAGLIDGLLIPGGEDVNPLRYGEEPHPSVNLTKDTKDAFEIELIREMRRLNKPVFGICRGIQVINVAFGGNLIQDIPTQTNSYICHKQSSDIRSEATHSVIIEKDTLLNKLLGDKAGVNSFHHQAVKDVAPGFKVNAKAPDGIIEGIESEDGMILGVQWHPECLYKRYPVFANLFKNLVEKAK